MKADLYRGEVTIRTDEGLPVARVFGLPKSDLTERVALATLMAAAPAMLETLQRIAGYGELPEPHPTYGLCTLDEPCSAGNARAVIEQLNLPKGGVQ